MARRAERAHVKCSDPYKHAFMHPGKHSYVDYICMDVSLYATIVVYKLVKITLT